MSELGNPWAPHLTLLEDENNGNSTCFTGLLCSLNELIFVKHLDLSLLNSNCFKSD